MEDFFQKYIVCPHCHSDLMFDRSSQPLVCNGCGRQYSEVDGVLDMAERSDAKAYEFDYLDHYKTDAEMFDYFEAKTGATEHSERRLREVIASVVPKHTKTILDVGCGSAWVARMFLPKGVSVCSLDASLVNPAKALKLFPSPHHYGLAADAFHLPFRDETIDCIIAAEIIEHVPDPSAFVKELLRVLSPGGTLILSTPYKEVIRFELCIHCNKLTPANAHLHSFDEQKLEALKEQSLFSFKTFNNKLLLFARMYVLLQYLPLKLWLIVDRFVNFLINKPVNIVVSYNKR